LVVVDEARLLHVGAPSISAIELEARSTVATYTFSYLALSDSKQDKESYRPSKGIVSKRHDL